MQRYAMTMTKAVLLLSAFACTFASARAQGGGGAGEGGGAAPVAAPNPYIQSAPTTSPSSMNTGATNQVGQDNTSGSGAAVFYPDVKTYILVAEDLINIKMFAVPEYTATLRLSNDGTAEIPLIGPMALSGLTIEKAQDAINTRLKSAGMYKDPHVTITLGEFDTTQSSVVLAGELHAQVPLRRLHTLAEVLASVGGLPPTASPIVSIIRPGVAEPILVDLGTNARDLAKANVPLEAHDTIFIQRLGGVYVVGAFKNSGLIPMQPGRTTLLQITALSGGPLYAAKYSDMRIIRTNGTQRTEVKVDIEKVLNGRAPDPIMQSGDIIFLPTSALKQAISSGGLNLLLTLANLAVIVAIR